jgi:hypothetical protein
MTCTRLLFLGLVSAAVIGAAAACDDEGEDSSDDGPETNLPLFSECDSVDQCAVGEEEGGACETTPSTPDTAICTTDCQTIAYDEPDPEVGGCYTPSPAETCAGGCCLIESVEVVNDFGDKEGTGICVPEAP